MSRSVDTLLNIKQEIQNDPTGKGYAGKTPSEIAILMAKEISFSPQQFIKFPPNWQEFIDNLTPTQISLIKTFLISKGITPPADQQIEKFTRRCDLLGWGDILQGDIEDALK